MLREEDGECRGVCALYTQCGLSSRPAQTTAHATWLDATRAIPEVLSALSSGEYVLYSVVKYGSLGPVGRSGHDPTDPCTRHDKVLCPSTKDALGRGARRQTPARALFA